MKFNPCTGDCTSNEDRCGGCGRSREEITETQLITKQLVEHLIKYKYDDPESFLDNVSKKAIKRSKKAQESN